MPAPCVPPGCLAAGVSSPRPASRWCIKRPQRTGASAHRSFDAFTRKSITAFTLAALRRPGDDTAYSVCTVRDAKGASTSTNRPCAASAAASGQDSMPMPAPPTSAWCTRAELLAARRERTVTSSGLPCALRNAQVTAGPCAVCVTVWCCCRSLGSAGVPCRRRYSGAAYRRRSNRPSARATTRSLWPTVVRSATSMPSVTRSATRSSASSSTRSVG